MLLASEWVGLSMQHDTPSLLDCWCQPQNDRQAFSGSSQQSPGNMTQHLRIKMQSWDEDLGRKPESLGDMHVSGLPALTCKAATRKTLSAHTDFGW